MWWFNWWVTVKWICQFFFFFNFTVEIETDNELISLLWLLTQECLHPALSRNAALPNCVTTPLSAHSITLTSRGYHTSISQHKKIHIYINPPKSTKVGSIEMTEVSAIFSVMKQFRFVSVSKTNTQVSSWLERTGCGTNNNRVRPPLTSIQTQFRVSHSRE